MARGPQGLRPQRGLGKAVRSLREEAGLTQIQLALKSSISASWLARIERGKADPTWDTMRSVALALDVSIKSLSEIAEGFEESTAVGS